MSTKKLNLANINKEYSKYDEREVISVLDGKYQVEIQKHFKKTDVQKLVIDFIQCKEELSAIDSRYEQIETVIFLFPILLIKYFTNISVPEKVNEMILLMNKLIDIDVLDSIIGSLPINEVKNISSLIQKMTDSLSEIEELAKLQEE